MSTSQRFAPAVLRVGLALVFLWFGWQQLADSERWLRMVPEYAVTMSGLTPLTLVHINGIVELVLGLCLLLGLYTRVVAALLTLNLLHILTIVGYGPVGARDFGLMLAMLAVTLFGADAYTLDQRLASPDRPIDN